MELLEHAAEATRKAKAEGAEQSEAFVIRYTTLHVYMEDDVPKVAEDREEAGLGLKVARGKRVAFASTTLSGAADAAALVRTAIRGLGQVPEDPDFAGFTAAAGKGEIGGVYDAATASAGVEGLLEAAKVFVDAAKERKGISVPKSTFRLQEYELRVVNSNGVDASHRGTLAYAYLTAKHASGSDVGEGIVHGAEPSLKDLDLAALGETCARRAVENREATAYKGKLSGVAVIDSQELGQLFLQSVGAAVCGQNVQKKRSPWAGKVGQEVGSGSVTIRDKPRLHAGLMSCSSDDEGAATKDHTLVQAGVLKGYIADTYHARLLGTEAGNAFRRSASSLEGAYTRLAQNYVSNLVLEPGVKSLEDLLRSVDRGVYVEKFAAPELDPISGAFACEVRNATLLEQGERKAHVKYALLTGNFYEGLRNVDGIGRDLEPIPAFYGSPGCACVPPVAFAGFELVGQT